MSTQPPPVRCDDPSSWRHKDEKIDLPRLLELIEENRGPRGLDLHGANLTGLDASPETLRSHLDDYRSWHAADAWPPWLAPHAGNVTSIHLSGAHLETAVLLGAQLQNANLEHAHLEHAVLEGAHLQEANLLGAQLRKANLRRAHLEEAHLASAHLEGADLSSAHLQSAKLLLAYLHEANLWFAHLENAVLLGAHLQNAHLRHAHVENANFVGATLSGASWYGAYLDRTRVRRASLGQAIGDELSAKGRAPGLSDFHDAKDAYLALKTNFNSIGRYDDASWAYVKEQQMEKAMHFPTTAGHRWIRQRMGHSVPPPWCRLGGVRRWLCWKLRSAFHHVCLFVGLCPRDLKQQIARCSEQGRERNEWLSRWRWARNWAFELLAGYGERVYMPVIWAAVVIALFAVIYTAAGNVATGDVGALQGQPTHSPWNALVHSISAFATIGFNTLEPQGWGARLLTALEAMFGIGLFALFVFTLGNRMRRS